MQNNTARFIVDTRVQNHACVQFNTTPEERQQASDMEELNAPIFPVFEASSGDAPEKIHRTLDEIESLRAECLRLPPYVKDSGSSKSGMREKLKDLFPSCFSAGMDLFQKSPQCVVVDASVWLGMQQHHSTKSLSTQRDVYTCDQILNTFTQMTESIFRKPDNAPHTVVLVFDIPEYVSKAKGCAHRTRNKAAVKSSNDRLTYITDLGYDDEAHFFGEAHYDQAETCIDAAERDARIKDTLSNGLDGIVMKKKLLARPTLEEMLQPDKPLPGPLDQLMRHKGKGRAFFLSWICCHLLQTVRLTHGQELIISGHCMTPADLVRLDAKMKNGDELTYDQCTDEETLKRARTTPVGVFAKSTREIFLVPELRSCVGEADQCMFFIIRTLWEMAPDTNNCFAIESTDTDTIYNGLSFLAKHGMPAGGYKLTVFNLYNRRAGLYCSLHGLFYEIEKFVGDLMGEEISKEGVAQLSIGPSVNMFGGPCSDPAGWDAVDRQATAIHFPAQKDAFISSVWHFIGLASLFCSDYSRSWPCLGPIKWLETMKRFPSVVLPLVRQNGGSIEYIPEAALHTVTCAYSLASSFAFKGRDAEILRLSPAQRCDSICRARRQKKQMRGVSLTDGDRKAFLLHVDHIPPGPVQMTARILNSQYYLYILQQCSESVLQFPDHDDFGYYRDKNGAMHHLYDVEQQDA